MMCYKTLCTIVASCNFSIIVIISLLSAKHFLTARALDEVKIGGIFDKNSVQVLTAFLHEVQGFNSAFSPAFRYQLKNETSILDVTDSFAVSNACEYTTEDRHENDETSVCNVSMFPYYLTAIFIIGIVYLRVVILPFKIDDA
ncbi:hypothetical protein C0Q70_05416 [Pomacea canaliculata]|uniref:Uncharacterized protein n=1 Tax=Pomacea canaliculata TaxID=400727 RepID=A0A2T7PL45_POMCA|nr:hypothetical protein C0Q70_05416 [Pomacea canaliculata]